MTATNQPKLQKKPTPEQIRRAVATSTAIETQRSVAAIEKQLKAPRGRFQDVGLAKPKS